MTECKVANQGSITTSQDPQALLKAWNGMSERARAAWVLRMDQPTAAALSGAIEKERKTHAGI